LIAIWLALAVGAVALVCCGLAAAPNRWPAAALTLWVFGELFLASRSLEYNNPNPESVYTASRPVLDALRQDPRPERILSIAATGYQPSDAARLVGPHEQRLGPNGVLATLINTKYKEVLNPNLSMVFGLPSIDGYDGGVLPLRRYVEYKRLVVPAERNPPDALLRDQVRQLPSAAGLRLLGVKYVLADTMADVTRDGVFYDLAGSVTLAPGQETRFAQVAGGPPTEGAAAPVGPVDSLGIVTALEGAAAIPDGTPVAAVAIGGPDPGQDQVVWRAELAAIPPRAPGRRRRATPGRPRLAGPPRPIWRGSPSRAARPRPGCRCRACCPAAPDTYASTA
jgi:hypothetical protein